MEFVSFKVAKKLKEKGLREECLANYNKNGILSYNGLTTDKDEYIDIPEMLAIHNYGDTYDAPMISQVLQWLRIEKKAHIVIDFDSDMSWYYQIAPYKLLTTYEKESEHKYNSYESAAIAGIEYCLDNLI